jgi:hypothetical protein
MTEIKWLTVTDERPTLNEELLAMVDVVWALVYPAHARQEFRQSPEFTATKRAFTAATRATRSARTRGPTERKLILFMFACCRLARRFINDPVCWQLVELGEQHADGAARDEELETALRVVRTEHQTRRLARRGGRATWTRPNRLFLVAVEEACLAARAATMETWNTRSCGTDEKSSAHWCTCRTVIRHVTDAGGYAAAAAGHREHPVGCNVGTHKAMVLMCDRLRDIFGNPFRPVSFDPSWRTGTVVTVARQMYESRVFGAMPILADALQDAGCDNTHILNHCQDVSLTHVRGCWVVDLVLEKH